MSSFNERLDEIVHQLAKDIDFEQYQFSKGSVDSEFHNYAMEKYEDEAKQAIASLIKELVADAINSECLALLNDLEEEQAACYSNHHKNSETFVPFVSLDTIQKAKEKYE